MAGAGNIILNTARGPYRVRRQPRLFGQPQQERSGLQTANDVMATIQNASKIASMVAPFIKTENKAAAQFNDARTNAAEAIEDVRLAQSRDDLEAQQVMEMAQAQQGAPQRSASMNPETHMPYGDVGPDMTQAQAAMDHARNQNVKEFMRDRGTQVNELEKRLGAPQMQPEVFTGVSPNKIINHRSTNGPDAQPQGIGREVGQMPQQESEQRLMDRQAVAAASQEVNPQGLDVMQPGATDFLRDVEMHPDQTPLSFTTMVEAQQAMQQAQSAGDLNAYNRASQAMLRSNMTDVRPQQWQDLVTGGHYRRAQQGLMKAVPPPKGMTALDKMRLKNMEDQIVDRGFKRVMSLTVEKRKQAIADMRRQMHDAKIPGAVADSVVKQMEARVFPTEHRSKMKSAAAQRTAAYAGAAKKRQETKFLKETFGDRVAIKGNAAFESDPTTIDFRRMQRIVADAQKATTANERKVLAASVSRKAKGRRSQNYATRSAQAGKAQAEKSRLQKILADLEAVVGAEKESRAILFDYDKVNDRYEPKYKMDAKAATWGLEFGKAKAHIPKIEKLIKEQQDILDDKPVLDIPKP